MKSNLIPPIMMRLAGLEVDECPKFLSKEPSEKNHSVYFPHAELRIPFQLEGIVSCFPIRHPTERDLSDNYDGEYLPMTLPSPILEPHTDVYNRQETSMLDDYGNIKSARRTTLN